MYLYGMYPQMVNISTIQWNTCTEGLSDKLLYNLCVFLFIFYSDSAHTFWEVSGQKHNRSESFIEVLIFSHYPLSFVCDFFFFLSVSESWKNVTLSFGAVDEPEWRILLHETVPYHTATTALPCQMTYSTINGMQNVIVRIS